MSTPYCRHVRTNGRRCCAFALRGQSFCFYHRTLNALHRPNLPTAAPTETIIHPLNLAPGHLQREPLVAEYFTPPRQPLQFDFPALDDRESIQLALSMLLTAMADNAIEPKRANTLLYGLQVASANARNLTLTPSEDRVVRDTILDDDGHELALDEDPEQITERAQRLADLETELFDDDEEDPQD